jgi:hypothetical protein
MQTVPGPQRHPLENVVQLFFGDMKCAQLAQFRPGGEKLAGVTAPSYAARV